MKDSFITVPADFLKRLYKSRYMLRMMALRELKASYVGSLFGLLWAVLNPLFQLAIYGIVFGVFFKSKPDPVYGTDNYFLFLLCGLVPWQFFTQAVNSTTASVTANFNLVKKAVGFPSEILPIVSVISAVISHLISLGLLVVIILIFTAKIPATALLIIAYLLLTALFAVGLGWMLSSVNVFLKDVQQVLGLVLMGWFFFTPVFYSPGVIPAWLLPVLKLNPVYHLVEGYRLALLAGRALPLGDFIYLAAISVITFGLGGVFFRRLKPWFAEVL